MTRGQGMMRSSNEMNPIVKKDNHWHEQERYRAFQRIWDQNRKWKKYYTSSHLLCTKFLLSLVCALMTRHSESRSSKKLVDGSKHAVGALEQHNDTLQLIILSMFLVGISFVLSSLLPYALVFFLGVICGRTGFVSLMKHSSAGAYKLGYMLFKKPLPTEPNPASEFEDSPDDVTNSPTTRPMKLELHQHVDHERRDSNVIRTRHFGAQPASYSKNVYSHNESSSDEEEHVDTSMLRRRSRPRGGRVPRNTVDFGQVISQIGSQVLNQWISN